MARLQDEAETLNVVVWPDVDNGATSLHFDPQLLASMPFMNVHVC